MFQQPLFLRGPPAIPADAIAADDAVTGDEYGHGISAAGIADRADRCRFSDGFGYLAVGSGLAERDRLHCLEYFAREWSAGYFDRH